MSANQTANEIANLYRTLGLITPLVGGAAVGAAGMSALHAMLQPTYGLKEVEQADLVRELENSTTELKRRTGLLPKPIADKGI